MHLLSRLAAPATLLAIAVLTAFSTVDGQCDTYFKRISSTVIPINGRLVNSADVTGDGVPDLLGISRDPYQPNIQDKILVVPATGSGGFGTTMTVDAPTGWQIDSIVVGNYDNDALPDLLVRLGLPVVTYRIYRNTGGGNFAIAANFAGSFGGGIASRMLDVNNDGKGDVVYASGTGFSLALGNGDGTFQAGQTLSSGFTIFPADINSDGLVDFVSGGNLAINLGGGNFQTIANGLGIAGSEIPQAALDVTGDGKPDVIAMIFSVPGSVVLFKNLGNNTFQRIVYQIPNTNASVDTKLYFGNFAGSTSPDVLIQSAYMKKSVVLVNDGTGQFTINAYNYSLGGPSAGNVFSGDFDADGKLDLVLTVDGTVPSVRRKILSELNATVVRNVCTPAGQTRIVDFDATNSSDLAYFSPSAGTWNWISTLYLNSSVSTRINFGNGSFGDIPAPGDFDGDGMTDATVYRNPTGEWWSRRSSDGGLYALRFGIPGDKPVVGDYDGDSIADVAVFRPSDGNWYVWLTASQHFTGVHWGLNGDIPVPEDYDGDGKTDYAIFRPSTGAWYILRSSDGGLTTMIFGLGTDRAVPADYDGDGKAEIAVYRNSQKMLYAIRSYNGDLIVFSTGTTAMIPIPADLNGDFIADLTGYEVLSQIWDLQILGSSRLYGAGDAVPVSSILKVQ